SGIDYFFGKLFCQHGIRSAMADEYVGHKERELYSYGAFSFQGTAPIKAEMRRMNRTSVSKGVWIQWQVFGISAATLCFMPTNLLSLQFGSSFLLNVFVPLFEHPEFVPNTRN